MIDAPNPTGKGGFGDNPENINRNGRPKGLSITEMVKMALEEVEEKTGKPWKELITKRILLKAVNDGDVQMLKAIWSYIDGMPKQTVDLDGDSKLTIEIVQDNRLKDGRAENTVTNKELPISGSDISE